MVALEIFVNGERICLAGAEDLTVLTAHVTAFGKLGERTVRPDDDAERDIFYSVGGLTSRRDPERDVHANWKSQTRLKIGDVVEIRILEAKQAGRAKSRVKANRKRPQKSSE